MISTVRQQNQSPVNTKHRWHDNICEWPRPHSARGPRAGCSETQFQPSNMAAVKTLYCVIVGSIFNANQKNKTKLVNLFVFPVQTNKQTNRCPTARVIRSCHVLLIWAPGHSVFRIIINWQYSRFSLLFASLEMSYSSTMCTRKITLKDRRYIY